MRVVTSKRMVGLLALSTIVQFNASVMPQAIAATQSKSSQANTDREVKIFSGKITSVLSDRIEVSGARSSQGFMIDRSKYPGINPQKEFRVGDDVVVKYVGNYEVVSIAPKNSKDRAGRAAPQPTQATEDMNDAKQVVDDRAFFRS